MIRKRAQRLGLTLVEVLTSLIILGVGVTAGLQALGSFAVGGKAWQDRSTAIELANALMAQLSALPFSDPAGPSGIGRESGEIADDRTTYDDIDDYDGWDASPPQDAAGLPMTAHAGFRQQVAVVFDESLPSHAGVSIAAGTFKKITVTISKNDKVLARLVTIRADRRWR